MLISICYAFVIFGGRSFVVVVRVNKPLNFGRTTSLYDWYRKCQKLKLVLLKSRLFTLFLQFSPSTGTLYARSSFGGGGLDKATSSLGSRQAYWLDESHAPSLCTSVSGFQSHGWISVDGGADMSYWLATPMWWYTVVEVHLFVLWPIQWHHPKALDYRTVTSGENLTFLSVGHGLRVFTTGELEECHLPGRRAKVHGSAVYI